MAENGLQAIVYAPGAEVNTLSVLDQLKLPNAHEYIEVLDTGKAWEVINKMNVSFSVTYRQAIASRIYLLRSSMGSYTFLWDVWDSGVVEDN